MNESENVASSTIEESSAIENANFETTHDAASPARQVQNEKRKPTKPWWTRYLIQPALFLTCSAVLIAGLGVAQRLGFISASGSDGHSHAMTGSDGTQFICPMMCTPPQSVPGRCPVCAMELVASTSAGGKQDMRSIQIDSVARRVANIHTVAVTSMPMARTVRVVGELNYDEGALKMISAYVDGRLERLYADYTGVVVKQGDHLAFVYSPRLYSGQVEFLLAKKSRENSRTSKLTRVLQSNDDLYANARQRLIELGMTEPQLDELERAGEANSRMYLCAPISGTVIEKMAVEGQYVKEGDPIYKLADLSTVWLMLRLFPEDAAAIRYGQKVEAEVQSLPGRQFTGRVAFIDPNVDPKTRTVGVRVVIANPDGLLRVRDYAKATIDVPLSDAHDALVYDPDLANKWISPRHPHVVADSAGHCPVCGVDLVPAAQLGFTGEWNAANEVLVVPRDAVLMAGNNSVLYVETEPGRFEIRRVVLGSNCGDQIVIRSGVTLGEHVATRGNFLIDSQMQLAGNPSLIDPTKALPSAAEPMSDEMIAALAKLSQADRALVERQRTCPVADYRLGSMGPPKKVDVNGTPVFICCDGCRDSLLEDPQKYLAKLAAHKSPNALEEESDMDVPPIGDFELLDTQGGLPPIDSPQLLIDQTTHSQPAIKPTTKRVADLPQEAVR